MSQVTHAGTSDAAKPTPTSEQLLDWIVSSLEAEKADDIVQIDLRERSEIADAMVICSGRSTRQVSALAEKLSSKMKEEFDRVAKIEGKGAGDWVLLDTGDVVVHIFRPEVREFYQLEKMWQPGATDTASDAETPAT